MLHCLEPVGVCLENYRTGLRWRDRVLGIFRAPEHAVV
jgi:hypothetical protein